MAGELTETTRLWARTVARIQPEWIEHVGRHLVRYAYSDPEWSSRRGGVVAQERVTLYGLPVVASRPVDFGRIDPELSRSMFIQHALVEGDWSGHHAFVEHNRRMVADVRALEDRVRRRDILVDEDDLFAFFDERVDREVVSARHFDRWWKTAREEDPALLDYTLDLLIDPGAGEVDVAAFPDAWPQDALELPLTYEFAPGSEIDGVTVHVPLAVLNQVTGAGFDWQVPGLREELVAAVVRSLPKTLRRHFVPVGDSVRAFLADHDPSEGALTDVLAADLRRRTGELVRPGDWELSRVPDHLRMNFRIEDERGRRVAYGKDLDELSWRLRRHLQGAITRAVGPTVEQAGLTSWTIGSLPRVVEGVHGGVEVRAFPALVDEGASVAVRLFGSADEQAAAMRSGTRRLLLLGLPSPLSSMQRLLKTPTKLALTTSPEESLADLLEDCVAVALDGLVDEHGGPAWDEASFASLREAVRGELVERSMSVAQSVARVLQWRRTISTRLDGLTAAPLLAARLDVRRQLAGLVHRGFVRRVGSAARMADVERYLHAVEHRLDRLGSDPARDAGWMQRVQPLEQRFERLVASLPAGTWGPGLEEARWMLEELRVGLFAQTVGTPYRVSEARVMRMLDELESSL
jgi:ATP-dependent helicase HrpA